MAGEVRGPDSITHEMLAELARKRVREVACERDDAEHITEKEEPYRGVLTAYSEA